MWELLLGVQQAHNLTDRAMAERLGISRVLWRAMRTGQRKVSATTVRKARTAFPELIPAATSWLLYGNLEERVHEPNEGI